MKTMTLSLGCLMLVACGGKGASLHGEVIWPDYRATLV